MQVAAFTKSSFSTCVYYYCNTTAFSFWISEAKSYLWPFPSCMDFILTNVFPVYIIIVIQQLSLLWLKIFIISNPRCQYISSLNFLLCLWCSCAPNTSVGMIVPLPTPDDVYLVQYTYFSNNFLYGMIVLFYV